MRDSKRIGIELLDPNLRALIEASLKVFPVNAAYVQAGTNPNSYEYVRITDGVERNNIYTWQTDLLSWDLIGADDAEIHWVDILNKPSTFTPTTHNHDDRYYTEAEMNASLALKANTADLPVLSTVATSGNYTDLSGKPTIPTDTNQLAKTDVYTKVQMDTSLASKSDNTHNHDGRYYTQSQVTSFLSGKSDITHNHDATYAVKSVETTVGSHTTLLSGLRTDVDTNTGQISTIQTNMANGDMHSNIDVLNQLTQALLDAWNSAVTHISDTIRHVTSAERTAWNAKSNFSGVYTDLTGKPTIPSATSQLTNDSGYQTAANVTTAIGGKADKTYVDSQDATKVDSTTFSGHTGNTTIHVTQINKDAWDAKQSALGFTPVNTTDGRLSDARTPLAHTHVITDVTGLQAALDGKVDDGQVLTNVPVGAIFTDTITTINSKTGAIVKADIVALGIPAQDTVYTHPASHPPSIITQDVSNRFVTDTEKSTWNAKQAALGYTPVNTTDSRLSDARTPLAHAHTIADITSLQTALDGKVDDGQVLTNVPVGALFTDTVYTHPATHPPSIIAQDANNRFMTDAERTKLAGLGGASSDEITVDTVQPTTSMWYKVI